MKGLVIYKGRYGATKQYAMWIGQELQLPVASADRFPVDELPKYDYFILGSSVYIGKLEIKDWLKKNFDFLKNKKILFFQVSASPPEQIEKRESYNNASLPPSILRMIQFYYLPGRMIIRNLSAWDRFMLKMGAKLTKDPLEKKAMLTDFDHVKKENILPVIDAIRRFKEVNEPEMEFA
ncbi:MAG TPA: flavodoxin domain-containing protein [Chitinophagaceae bacterium]|jgi:menaquinone-dependent protoporphyrinogen IX oxidase|nr:flavodoxin domain-containing protein [Chitinophagaceae bacterium]